MDLVPKISIKSLTVGDVLTGQDGNKYMVCEEAGILYWKPYVSSVTIPQLALKPTPKPIKKVKEVKEKYYWKDNDKKPRYKGDNMQQMEESLAPKVSPTKFPAGYVWTTKFSNILYVVDTQYKGYSKTPTRFWYGVSECPPCLDAEDYPYEYNIAGYSVAYDEQGNKFWSRCICNDVGYPLLYANKFVEGHIYTTQNGSTYKRTVMNDGSAEWEHIANPNE